MASSIRPSSQNLLLIEQTLLEQCLAIETVARPWDGSEAFCVDLFFAVQALAIFFVVDAGDRFIDEGQLPALVLGDGEHYVLGIIPDGQIDRIGSFRIIDRQVVAL